METEKRAEEQKRTEALELLKSNTGNTQCQRKGQGTGDKLFIWQNNLKRKGMEQGFS